MNRLEEIKKAFEDALNDPKSTCIDYFLKGMIERINNEIELSN